ncbi:III, C31 subunit of DNA-directed RNA polymerase [Suhomyces tanzawaensis NRRL Y-17324]|uniref:DNA-directed RNA polymerase III subunit n=1 Tax=Suhomyces tanzawaensis NRRL Y-17324 TaxID=984487 RepID=A0A1E4SRN3_9ASCO|nr:III, C31 subunit of DNA-directed RNA polymerase [Suhomyces tanzawaensis NRRL Y-17324]ODV82161.1 III, C31 subunit of DNA-directed RNA polymerase [Suhomyces tanzawaensis NRRL Y-17324]
MSFRGRGSGRALLPFGLDYSDVLSSNHETEKAQIILPVNGPLNQEEESEAKQAIAFAKLMADGSFYTGTIYDAANTDDKTKVVQKATAPDGIERYSDKYKKVKKIGRTIEEHPYQLEVFPEELYSVMGVSKQKKKLLALSTFKSNGGLREFNLNNPEETEDEQAKSMLEKLRNLAEELDNGDENKDENEEDLEEDMDEDFDEDDDDDYNAEKYFDDGDDDVGDAGGDDEAAF